MKNILSILTVLALFLVSTTAFAAEGPMKLPSGAKPEAVSHTRKALLVGTKRIIRVHWCILAQHPKLTALLEKSILTRRFVTIKSDSMEWLQSILELP